MVIFLEWILITRKFFFDLFAKSIDNFSVFSDMTDLVSIEKDILKMASPD